VISKVIHLGVSSTPHSATPQELLERHRLSSTAIEDEALGSPLEEHGRAGALGAESQFHDVTTKHG